MSAIDISRDAALLAALHATAFDRPWAETEFVQLLANPAVFALVLRRDETALGFALAWAAAGDSELLTLTVKPGARRGGLGAALVEAILAHAHVRGAQSLILDVAEDNDAGRGLYLKLGFAEIGRRKAYYHMHNGDIDALTMRKSFA